jgi:outer membrane protein
LQQCIDIAIKNNLDVKRSELQMETGRINWHQTRENLLPDILGDVTHSLNNGRSLDPTSYTYANQQITTANYGLNGNLVLFNGFAMQNSIKQASLAYQAGKMDYQQVKDLITLNIITTYLQVLNNEDQLTQANNQLVVSQKQVERLNIQNKEGNVKPSDLYDLRGKLATDQLSVINAKSAMNTAKLALLQIMNVTFDKNIKLDRFKADETPSAYSVNADDIYHTALNDLALVKAATLYRESAEKGVSAAKGNLLPAISLSGGLATNYSSGSSQSISYASQLKNNYNTYASIGLNIPVLRSFQNKNRVALAKINLLNAKYTEESTQIQLKQNVEQAYLNMTSAFDRYQILISQVNDFSESFRIAEIRFNAGVLTSVDFVVAKNNFDQATSNLISARYDYLIRTKILDYYQGKLSL